MRPKSISDIGKRVLAFAFVLGLGAVTTPGAPAQTFSAIYSFGGGSDPTAGLIIDEAGSLYGTTEYGPGVFKYNGHGLTVLHTFTGGSDGAYPEASLVMDAAGNLYGTTTAGGASNAGTVFEVTAQGEESVLYSFTGDPDGAVPESDLVMDSAGNLYGTTTAGGSSGNGTVFELSVPKTKGGNWTETVLYSFGQGTDGAIPVAGVTFDTKGKLYGTTSAGGLYGYGTVFRLGPSKSGWKESILYNFQEESDGGVPYAGVIFDSKGRLYGAATDGGSGGENGGGTIFTMEPSSSGWKFTVIYQLAGWGPSGSWRNLLLDANGSIYATTHCDGVDGSGTVFRLKPSGDGTWTFDLLYSFTGGTDGLFSIGNLVLDKQGDLFGTTQLGGEYSGGVIYKVKP